MKRLILILCILFSILIGSVFFLFWLKNYSESTANMLQIIAKSEERQAKEKLEELLENWEKTKRFIGIVVHEAELDSFSENLRGCLSLLQQKKTAEFQIAIEKAIFSIAEIYQKELPTLENVL